METTVARAFKSDVWERLFEESEPFNINASYTLEISYWRKALNIMLALQPQPKCYNAETFFKKYQIKQLNVDDHLKASICVEIVKLIRKK